MDVVASYYKRKACYYIFGRFPNVTGKKVENEIKKWLDKNGFYYIKTVGGSVPAGTPDIIACVNGFFIGIEVKRPKGGKVSELQKFKIRQIKNSGGYALHSNSLEGVVNYLQRHNII